MNTTRQPLSVTEVTRKIRQLLESGFPGILILGEISNLKRHPSGHTYFSLKDEHAQIAAVLWRSRAALVPLNIEDGMKVIVSGRLTVYESRGAYQIEVYGIRPFGVGELQLRFERLKQRLAAEGLFDPTIKKPLPPYPERIGIVTSPSGAALQDILNVLNRRFPALEVILHPVRVQGAGAAEEIARAIRTFNDSCRVDVIIVGRGGGSLEDLWPFNEEIVARAIRASRIPLVTAVGHEIDFTIADLAADVRAATPSAAAELVVKEQSAVLENLNDYWYTMTEHVQAELGRHRETIRHIHRSYSFHRPFDLLRQSSQRLDDLERGLGGIMRHNIALLMASSDALRQRVATLDPMSPLRRGYALVRKENRLVTSGKVLRKDDVIDITFRDSVVRSTVV